MKFSGIYTITNKINQKIYLGCATNIANRWKSHRSYLRLNKHNNTHLQRAWNKYGEENFEFELLIECEEVDLYSEENYWCNLLNCVDYKYGYNIKSTSPTGNFKMSEESKRKLAISATGRKHTQETKDKISEISKLKKLSKEHKEILVTCNKSRVWSKESRKKASEANIKRSGIKKCIEIHEVPILQFDLEGSFIKEYSSITKASQENKVTRYQIYSQCYDQVKTKTRKSTKFIWKLKE